jgi:hypothetical protein
MATFFGPIAAAVPLVALTVFLIALLRLTDRVQRGREDVRARQIVLTDAIHARLGAIVAPTLLKRPWGRWQVRIAVPFARPDVVSAVLSIADDTMRTMDRRPRDFRIVLTPQEDASPGRRR